MTTTPVLAAEDLAAITGEVWTAFLLAEGARPLRPATVGTAGTVGTVAGDTVHATVEVAGAWTGRVDLALDASSADLAARTMLRLDPGSPAAPADVLDAVGELANMVGGNVKSLVPAPSTLGLPAAGPGPVPAGGPVECEVALDWHGHVVRVVVRSA